MIQVVVYTKNGRSMGLVVDQVYDVVEEMVILQEGIRREGIIGSAVIQENVTEILDKEI
jgi:two-component system chemotaxis sensor kinase CheA